MESGGQEHGALVQQILETQKELQDGNKRERVEIEREAAVRFLYHLVVVFSCPSSSIPTLVTDSLTNLLMVLDLEPSRPNQTKPT